MLYFKYTNLDIYAKFNEETNELIHLSIYNSNFSVSIQVIDELQIDYLKSELATSADYIEESDFILATALIKEKIANI